MRLPKKSNLGDLARNLRNNATKAERKLWFEFLRTCHPHWYRQRIISNFILDFYCPKARLAIEVDGGQHYGDKKSRQDDQRTFFLKSLGIETIRFTNNDVVDNFDQVCISIDEEIKQILAQV